MWREEFAVDHDPAGLRSERNLLRHRPFAGIGVYVAPDAAPRDVAIATMASRVAGLAPVMLANPATRACERVRVIGSLTRDQLDACHAVGVELDLTPPVAEASVELRHWVREQAISWTRHRHGRLLD